MLVKVDGNGRTVEEAIGKHYTRKVDVTSTGVKAIDIPANVYKIVVKRLPVDADLIINGDSENEIPLDYGDEVGSFMSIESLEVNVKGIGTADKPIVLILLT